MTTSPSPQGPILVTGVAGFIGFHVAETLLAQGHSVIGVDNLNAYYDIALKNARLEHLSRHQGLTFHQLDIADHKALRELPNGGDVKAIIHLAAQAGVRYSIDHPFEYASSNLVGHLSVLEFARHAPQNPRLVYASSSSVYGANTKAPFSENDPVRHPVSLYAATKRADELMSETYAHLYDIEQIGLRFFTVYGPWGRPDMAAWLFTQNIIAGEPIRVFNNGELERDFTYIDDIANAVVAVACDVPKTTPKSNHRLYNIGNNKPAKLMDFIALLENIIGKKADIKYAPMQPGDVHATYADINAIQRDYGFYPKTSLRDGLEKFVDWYKDFYGVDAE